MATDLARFYPFIEPEVMGCPYPVIDHHLRLAIRDFCDRAKVWKEWQDAVTLDGSTNRFDYDLTTNQELVQVRRALLNGEELVVKQAGDLPADWTDSDPAEITEPTLVHFDTSEYMLFPMLAAGDSLVIEIVMRPSLTATSVGDIIYTRYADKVADGCKAQLKAMLDQPWGNEKLAAFYGLKFERSVHAAANEDFSRGKGSHRTKPWG